MASMRPDSGRPGHGRLPGDCAEPFTEWSPLVESVSEDDSGPRVPGFIISSVLAIGLSTRLLPFLGVGGPLRWLFPTEDGYLMLTAARNLALGHGLSTAAGLIPTNGVQPLFAGLEALVFLLTGGGREAGLIGVMAMEVLIACVSWIVLRRLLVHPRIGMAHDRAGLVAAVWFAAPSTVLHGMNGLETGLLTLLVLMVAEAWCGPVSMETPSARAAAPLGLLLGVTFLARNDAVLLGVALAVPMMLRGTWRALLAMGAGAVIVGLPWVLFNATVFGSIVPVSGTAQSLGTDVWTGLSEAAAAFLEMALVVVPLPGAWEAHPAATVTGAAVGLGLLASGVRRTTDAVRFPLALWALLLLVVYTGWSSASYFMERYLFPLSPFLAAVVGAWALRRLDLVGRGVRRLAAAALVLVLLGGGVHVLTQGRDNRYRAMAMWVDANVEDQAWVASLQSGTVGFFHDRTLNLDGKVNPEALAARRAGRLDAYVLDPGAGIPPPRYVVGWAPLAGWLARPDIAAEFEAVATDGHPDLAVLRRR